MNLQELLADYGISVSLYQWVILPLLIFFARIMDVSINTLRVIFMLSGRKYIATLLGFFEALVWLLAISQILQNLENFLTYLAYAGGFASGIFAGMYIENKLALGNLIIRLITVKDASVLIQRFSERSLRFTVLDGVGNKGPVSVIFLVIRRQQLEEVTALVESTNPQAMFTVESVKSVKEFSEALHIPRTVRYSFFRNITRR
ncbi:MAG: DUF2179 domain-containing protein [Cyclobacteriaceae bacterium]|nr:DUF2179 domain-containing protein [Cyclobacteriaceae bacterium]